MMMMFSLLMDSHLLLEHYVAHPRGLDDLVVLLDCLAVSVNCNRG